MPCEEKNAFTVVKSKRYFEGESDGEWQESEWEDSLKHVLKNRVATWKKGISWNMQEQYQVAAIARIRKIGS